MNIFAQLFNEENVGIHTPDKHGGRREIYFTGITGSSR